MRKITGVSVPLAILLCASGCDKADFKGAEAEVKKIEANLDLPPVPAFDVPAPQGSTHGPRELRLMGQKLLGTEVEVKGFVTYKYNCLTDGGLKGPVGGPDADEKKRLQLIKDEPHLWCFKQWMVLNDTPDGNPKVGLRVTFDDFDELNKKRISKARVEWLPGEKEQLAALDAIKVGDELTITGKFSQSSPLGFGDSRGLLIYKNPMNEGLPEQPKQLPL